MHPALRLHRLRDPRRKLSSNLPPCQRHNREYRKKIRRSFRTLQFFSCNCHRLLPDRRDTRSCIRGLDEDARRRLDCVGDTTQRALTLVLLPAACGAFSEQPIVVPFCKKLKSVAPCRDASTVARSTQSSRATRRIEYDSTRLLSPQSWQWSDRSSRSCSCTSVRSTRSPSLTSRT